MPTAQSSKTTQAKTSSAKRSPSQSAESATGERDENYNLISVLYHALQGAETSNKYLEDAKESGDEELADFFEEACSSQSELAQRAKQLLASRLDSTDLGDDEEEDEDEE